ncbi:MAG TPA: hypothetical protein VFE05_08135 [Longimicrobiaceae bacterium]|nr:hypothetical protein [Longimicrobiaceae bacterium]
MKLARTFLAALAVTALAACSSDPVGVADRQPRTPAHRDITPSDPGVDPNAGLTDGGTGLTNCVTLEVVVNGVLTATVTCDGRGPQIGTGT